MTYSTHAMAFGKCPFNGGMEKKQQKTNKQIKKNTKTQVKDILKHRGD